MPLLKYFLYVGTLLWLLLYGCSEYLKPSGTKTQADPPPARLTEVLRPAATPSIAQQEQPRSAEASEPPIMNDKFNNAAKAAPAKTPKKRARVTHRRVAPLRTFGDVPRRPFFFD